MHKSTLYLSIALLTACTTAKKEQIGQIMIENPTELTRSEVIPIDISKREFANSLNIIGIGKVGNTPIEGIDSNKDGLADKLVILTNMDANASISIDLLQWQPTTDYPKKTQAEISHAIGGAWEGREYLERTNFQNVDFLSVPAAHTDHSWYIRYEGPGWENELIGYRFYLDWRNAADIFGKKVDTLVLQLVGQDGFDSYHEETPWGMDILKAGKSLGIGSIGMVNDEGTVEHFESTDSVTCEILHNGYLSSTIETNYYGWNTSNATCNLKSTLTINTGDRATTHKVQFDNPVNNFCTGIVKHPEGIFFQETGEEWGYIATYGRQTLFDDQLGMAIFYQKGQLQKIDTTDTHNHLVVFKPATEVTYQLLGAWEKEPNGIQNRSEFETYLSKKLKMLDSPIRITP